MSTLPARPTTGRLTRRIFAATVLGLSADRSVYHLKQKLFEAAVVPTAETPLDLVMVEDYGHLTELLAEEGYSLWRNHAEVDQVVRVRYVQVPRRWFWPGLVILLVLMLISAHIIWVNGWVW